jgi:7-cyano-7-deazaguanine synthase
MSKTVVIFSGGMDSYTLLNAILAHHEFGEVHAISFDYGQRHNKELIYARNACTELGVSHTVVNLGDVHALARSALTGDCEVPHGHYEEESMSKTVVPHRNMLFITIACMYADRIGAKTVYYGAHSGDHAIYPDCRPEFVEAMNQVLAASAGAANVTVEAPFLHLDKGDIASIGADMGLDYDKTWTCYEGGDTPCGKCGACVERAEAMDKAYG